MGNEATRRALRALTALSLALLIFPAWGDVAPEMSGTPRLAIAGYDTVAYHTVGKAIPGKVEYQTIWHGARWLFSSMQNLDLFAKDPEKYAAQYESNNGIGVVYEDGRKDTVNPEAFTIVN